jgi:hypothetical protein
MGANAHMDDKRIFYIPGLLWGMGVILSKSSARPNSDNAIPKPNKRKRFPDVDTGNG